LRETRGSRRRGGLHELRGVKQALVLQCTASSRAPAARIGSVYPGSQPQSVSRRGDKGRNVRFRVDRIT
jgi:hypothetical protein